MLAYLISYNLYKYCDTEGYAFQWTTEPAYILNVQHYLKYYYEF